MSKKYICLLILFFISEGRCMLGGEEIPITQIPFQGSVEAIGSHLCSAAILSSKYALITAVCAEGFRLDVGIATLRFGTTSRNYDGERYKSTNVYQHPNFDQYNNTYEQKDYDIAVVEIYPELEFDNVTIGTISIADNSPSINDKANISGWGSIKNDGAIMVYVRSTTVAVTEFSSCRSAYSDIYPVTDRMLCAGDPGVICNGDHGDLLVNVNGKLIGLASWSSSCGQTGVPDVYTNLLNPEIRQFIADKTGL